MVDVHAIMEKELSIGAQLNRKEVSLKDTTPATFTLLHFDATAFLDVLETYAHTSENSEYGYRLIIDFNQYFSRGSAQRVTWNLLAATLGAIKNDNLQYTIDWWYRTPSDAGVGPLLIGIRICDIREMVQGLV